MVKLNKLNLLYIEDHLDTRKNYSKSFKLIFNKVFLATNYNSAIKIFQQSKIDVVLVDIELNSDKNGFNIANKIKTLNKNIPIVFLTGHDEKEYILEAINSSMNGYLIKPLNLEKFLDLIISFFKSENQIYFNDYIYNLDSFELFDKNKKKILLGKKENELLQLFLKNKNKLLNREYIEYEIWKEPLSSDSTLKNLIANLRKKIGKDAIVNISKLGWKIQFD